MGKRCIVKILGKNATTFAACFYNEMKVARGEAKCLALRNFGSLQEYNIHSPVVMSNYLQKIADHNTLVQHPQKHMVWSFPGKATPEEQEQLLKDAQETFDRLGYKDQPQAFWVHFDSNNFHIHGVTVTVSVKNGQWIDNYYEGRRARRILDQLRGYNVKSEVDKFLEYKFESREQFKSLLLASGCRCHYDEENKTFDIFTNHDTKDPELTASVSADEVDARIAATGKNKDNQKERIKQLRGILLDRRRRSLKMSFGDDPIKTETKAKRTHTIAKKLEEVKSKRFNGDKGLDLSGERKAQFKQFLMELKDDLAISIVFSKYQDGKTKGYTLIDHQTGTVFKGSDVVDLQKLLNPDWRKGQAKDTIIRADDASAMAEEIRVSDSLPLAIKKQLEELGVEVAYSEDTVLYIYGNDSEDVNREKAAVLMEQVVELFMSNADATEEGSRQIHDLAKEAICRAVAAEKQKGIREEQEQEQKESELSEADKVARIIERAKDTPIEELTQYIIDVLDDHQLNYKFGNYSTANWTEVKARNTAITCLEKALTEEDLSDRLEEASKAANIARIAEKLHNANAALEQPKQASQSKAYEPDVQKEQTAMSEPDNEKPQDGAKKIPFVDIVPVISYDNGRFYISAEINGVEYSPKVMSSQHAQWYMRQQNQEQAAHNLALHYFADEIQKAQVDEWKNKHYENGKMPDGSKVMDVRATTDGVDLYETTGRIVKDGQSVTKSGKIERAEYIKMRNASTAEMDKIFCQTVGKEHLSHWGFFPLTQMMPQYFGSEQAPEDSVDALKQSEQLFDDFTDMLCKDFIAACGNVAQAYLEGLGGDGRGSAGGSENNDLSRKKDDDDRKVHSGIMNAKPTKKGGLKK